MNNIKFNPISIKNGAAPSDIFIATIANAKMTPIVPTETANTVLEQNGCALSSTGTSQFLL